MNQNLKADPVDIARFCVKHHIRRLSLFGSLLRGNAGPQSDIDFLVEFESGKEPGLLALAEMETEMSAMLGGQAVDLRTPKDLSRFYRDEVIRSAQVQYAR